MIFKLNPTTTKYDPGNAYWMARIALHAYVEKADKSPNAAAILKLLKVDDSNFAKAVGFNVKSSQGLVIKHKHCIVVAFRGTDEPADWLDNVNALSVDYAFGEVHRGFQAALMDIWPQMKSAIRSYQPGGGAPRLPVWITGHSLGGAMATLAAAQLVDEDAPFYGVYTFGQPRVGDRTFARTYNVEAASRSFRFQNNNDIVTRIPARIMGYSHVGKFVYISDKKKLSTDSGSWFRFLDSVRGAVKDIGDLGLDGVDDHGMHHYLNAIESWGDKIPDGGF